MHAPPSGIAACSDSQSRSTCTRTLSGERGASLLPFKPRADCRVPLLCGFLCHDTFVSSVCSCDFACAEHTPQNGSLGCAAVPRVDPTHTMSAGDLQLVIRIAAPIAVGETRYGPSTPCATIVLTRDRSRHTRSRA